MTPFLRIYDSVSNLRYRNPAFLSPPSLRDTSPYHKGRHDWWVRHPLTIGLILTHDSLPLHDWWVRHPLTIGEAWGGVPPPLTIRREKGQKRKGDNVLHSIYAFRPNKPKKVTVKTRRYKQDAEPAEVRGECTQKYMTRRSRKADNAERRRFAFRPNKLKKVTVKTRRYKQDAKDKAFRRGAYSNVRDPRKTQSDNVLRCIYAFRPNKPKK